MSKITTFLIFSLTICFLNASNVPVFVWTNEKDARLPQVLAGNLLKKSDFEQKFIESSISSNIFLFLQDEISISEILTDGGVYGSDPLESKYKNLKSLMIDHTSSYLPFVEQPTTSLDISNFPNVIHLKKDFNLNQIIEKLKNGKNNLIIVDFSKFENSDQSYRDEMIGKLSSVLNSASISFLAFYTSRHSSKKDKNEGSVGEGRHLLATNDDKENNNENNKKNNNDNNEENNNDNKEEGDEEEELIKGKQFLMAFDGISFDGMKSNTSLLPKDFKIIHNNCSSYHANDNDNKGNSSSVPDSYNCSIVLSASKVQNLNFFNISLGVKTSGKMNSGYWYISRVDVTISNSSKLENFVMEKGLTDPTPLGNSYSCYEQDPLYSNSHGNSTNQKSFRLDIRGLQIQVFNQQVDRFGYYNDCVGFFTIGIWMFLVSSAILVSILLFGISMLLNLKTMDRYDDPKGKSIQIAAAE